MKTKVFSKLKVKDFSKQQMQRIQGGAPTCGTCVDLGCPPYFLCPGCPDCWY